MTFWCILIVPIGRKQGLENMILAQGEESSFVHCGGLGSNNAAKDEEKSESCIQIPEVTKEIGRLVS